MRRILIVLMLLAVLAACAPLPQQPTPRVEGKPVEIVQKYYGAWAKRDYTTMYSFVSDGWKTLEPTAHTEADFAKHLNGFYAQAKAIRLAFASEQYNTGSEAGVSVALEVQAKDNRFLTTNQSLTLRLKENGWKLIHPYGEYKDLS